MVPRARAALALDGLSVGDAFGQRFFGPLAIVLAHIEERRVPPAPWAWTDDTAMALSVYEVLVARGCIDRDLLAQKFAERYVADPRRGYGASAHDILRSIARGVPWREAASSVFGGQGSMGNGGAMRAAPIGAYFADDLDAVVTNARASAEPTHAHPDGQAGAVAVAVATALAWRSRTRPMGPTELLRAVAELTPPGPTREGIERAAALPLDCDARTAAATLGSGERVIASDTVPFSLWCAARHLGSYEDALWTTVSGLGDRDTTCAIVGGIVAVAVGPEGIPASFLAARESLEPVRATAG